MSLVARILEANGIATVVIGSAMDVVTYCGVPRYVHSDLPLGNPCGVPYDRLMQRSIVITALSLLEDATRPNSVIRSCAKWSGMPHWRDDYSKVDDSNREQLRLKGEARRLQQAKDKAAGKVRASMISES